MNEEMLPTNWGRWGDDDQRGTLNLIDGNAIARAAEEVRVARHVSLARTTAPATLTTGLGLVGSPVVVPAAVMQVVNFTGTRPMALTDSLFVNTHNADLTHLDAVAHIPVGDEVYPGVALSEAVTPAGVRHGAADSYGDGIVTRGVLVDLAPGGGALEADRRIGARDLDAALDREQVALHPGDALVLRGGWDTNQPAHLPVPGLDLSAVGWLHERGVSLYIGDIGDSRPPTIPFPMHQVALARLGMPLVDAARLDDLATACDELERWSFMLVIAPPRISGTTGLAVNPIAIF